MGRKSVLTPDQWANIERRHVVGAEPVRQLAREFGISEAAIRARISARVEKTKSAANQIVAAESVLKSLPISAQINAQDLASRLRAVSDDLLSAATYSSATAHRLASIAHVESEKIDETEPTAPQSLKALQGIALLTKMANASSEIGINLLRANKEQIDGMNRGDDEAPAGLDHFYGDSGLTTDA